MKRKIALTLVLSALMLAACNSESQSPQTEQNVTSAAETLAVTKSAEAEQAVETSVSESSADIAVSREYEFDAEKYIDGLVYKDQWQLRSELDFLSDEQYDVFIRAWIFIDMIEPLNVVSIRTTSEIPKHYLDKNGEVCASYYNSETKEYAQYEYVSTYQSFYKYLQSVFTQDAVDEIMSDRRFLTVGDELYFSIGEAGGAIDFKGGEYRLVEKNDDKVVFEYAARQENDEKEWTETHPIRLVRTADGWRSELFEHLKRETAKTSEALPLKVNISEHNYNTDINMINLPSFTVGTYTNEDLEKLSLLKNLNYLRVSSPSEDIDLSLLSSLESLKSLSFSETADISAVKNENVKELLFYDSDIEDLSYIFENMPNLKSLQFINCDLEKLSFGNENDIDLSSLYFENCNLGNTDFFNNLQNLKSLIFWDTEISDVGFLSELGDLKSLCISGAGIENAEVVSSLTSLESLTLSRNPLGDVSYLSALDNLTELDISECNADSIDFIGGMTGLKDFNASDNFISDISVLSGMTGLKGFGANNNSISDISVLKGLDNLESLSVAGNNIENIDVIAELKSIEYCDISGNRISDISVLGSSNSLKSVNPYGDLITDEKLAEFAESFPEI